MYTFKVEKKEELLKGRTIKYLAQKKLYVTPEYLVSILTGKRGCSKTLANNISKLDDDSIDAEEYFYRKEEEK